MGMTNKEIYEAAGRALTATIEARDKAREAYVKAGKAEMDKAEEAYLEAYRAYITAKRAYATGVTK